MDFGRSEVGGRRFVERLGVDRLAAGQAPGPVAGTAARLQLLHRRNLAVERGIDGLSDDVSGAAMPVACDALGGRPLGHGLDH